MLVPLIMRTYVWIIQFHFRGGLLRAGEQLASTVEEDESLERLLIQLLCNLSGFKNNQQKLGEPLGGMQAGRQARCSEPPSSEASENRELLSKHLSGTFFYLRGKVDSKTANQRLNYLYLTVSAHDHDGTPLLMLSLSIFHGATRT